MVLGDSLWHMVLGVWFWVYGFGHKVWLWAYGFWAYGFGRMGLGVWFGFGRMVLGVWLWAYGFGCIALGIVWTYDFGGTTLQMRVGQAPKYIPILNRKINDYEHYYTFRCMRNFCHHLGILLNSHNGFSIFSTYASCTA